jgi:hypothetical protein
LASREVNQVISTKMREESLGKNKIKEINHSTIIKEKNL